MNSKTSKHVLFLTFVFLALFFALLIRVGWIQFVKAEEYVNRAAQSRVRNVEITAERGLILDRNMNPLAVNIKKYSVSAIPQRIKTEDKLKTAKIIAEILELNETQVIDMLERDSGFVWLKRMVDDKVIEKLKQEHISGIQFVEETQRYYPKENLASHIIGFSGIDNQGLNGLELFWDKELRGENGKIVIEYDGASRELPQASYSFHPPQIGNTLVLTIDETIQYIVERELKTAVEARNAKKGIAVVLDVKTGDILGMASYPDYDPNNFGKYDKEIWRNSAVSDIYEPGSTFKILVAAASLEESVVKPNDTFYCSGTIKVASNTIRCWYYPRAHGHETFREGVQNSCNPVFVTVGTRLGLSNLYSYLNAFGFGKRTGVMLPGEAAGLIIPENRARGIDLATMSIGQSIAVTPLQLTSAIAAVANGGILMKPRIVREIRDKDGNIVHEIPAERLLQVVSEETSHLMNEMLESVVNEGTGRNARIFGYKVAGKTGTAQKILPTGGYSEDEFISSFAGYAPADKPEIACLVILDSAQGIYYGGTVAAPVFRNIINDSLRYLQIPVQLDDAYEQKKTVYEENQVSP